MAENKDDLDRDTPFGGRVRAAVVTTDGSILDAMSGALDTSSGATIQEDPSETQVSGNHAVAVAIEQNGIRQRAIYVHQKGKDAIVFTLEAPSPSFAAVENDLASVPGLAS